MKLVSLVLLLDDPFRKVVLNVAVVVFCFYCVSLFYIILLCILNLFCVLIVDLFNAGIS